MHILAASLPVLSHRSEGFDLLSTSLLALPWSPNRSVLRVSRTLLTFRDLPRLALHTYPLLHGNDRAKNHFGCIVVTTEKKDNFPFPLIVKALVPKYWIRETRDVRLHKS